MGDKLGKSRREVAEEYGVSPRTVDRWVDRGAVEKVKLGGTVRIRTEPDRDGGAGK